MVLNKEEGTENQPENVTKDRAYIQGVSWELTKSISFVLGPGGIPEAKTEGKQFVKHIHFDNRFYKFRKWNFAFRIQLCLNWAEY